jgi:hypothetical protein
MLADVPTMDGRAWAKQRIANLQELLRTDDLTPEQRTAVEAELATLKQQRRGILGWLLPTRLPHQR